MRTIEHSYVDAAAAELRASHTKTARPPMQAIACTYKQSREHGRPKAGESSVRTCANEAYTRRRTMYILRL